jgi:hypothetical protein
LSRVYSIPIATPTAETAQVDLFEIAPADDKLCIVHGIRIYQISDFGDAQEEILGIEIRRGGTGMTSGSGGSSVTPVAMNPDDPAAGFTAEALNTTLATFTSGLLVWSDGWNVRAPYTYDFLPEDRPIVKQTNGGLVVRLGAAPADSLTIGGSLIVEEV